MSVICKDVMLILEQLAPLELAEDWDNVGLIIGRSNRKITTILIALDATETVVDEAIALGAELIVTHHPIIFKAISKINNRTTLGEKILKLLENKISVYCAHTNLDIANGGTNDELAKTLNLSNIKPMIFVNKNYETESLPAIGRIGELIKPISLSKFSTFVKEKLKLDSIRFVGDANKTIKIVGLSTGSGSNNNNFNEAVKLGCDVFITGDIRFHEAQDALDIGLSLIDTTHYASENLIVNKLNKYITSEFEQRGIEISVLNSKVDGQVFKNNFQ